MEQETIAADYAYNQSNLVLLFRAWSISFGQVFFYAYT
jgi:hypothetical protein